MSLTDTDAVADAAPAQADAPLQAWFDGRFVDADAPCAPLTSHAMHYGSGVFEGIRAYATADGGSAVFRLPEHLARMRRGFQPVSVDGETQADGDRWHLRMTVEGEREPDNLRSQLAKLYDCLAVEVSPCP